MIANKYYCHPCAQALGYMPSHSSDEDFTGSLGSYTLDKYIKHTSPYLGTDTVSIFSDPDYDSYKNHIVNTQASGSVEFDSKGRKNIVWMAGMNIGFTFQNNGVVIPNDSVKVICTDSIYRIHAYPTSSVAMRLNHCDRCGCPVLS